MAIKMRITHTRSIYVRICTDKIIMNVLCLMLYKQYTRIAPIHHILLHLSVLCLQ